MQPQVRVCENVLGALQQTNCACSSGKRLKPVIDLEVTVDKLPHARAMVRFSLLHGLSEAGDGDCWTGTVSKDMYGQAILNREPSSQQSERQRSYPTIFLRPCSIIAMKLRLSMDGPNLLSLSVSWNTEA